MEENSVSTEQAENTEARTYTQDEVNELLQKEGDKRVTEALKKAERKNAARVKEAEKLAQMNEGQKYQYQLEQREKAIQEKESALALAENKAAAAQVLSDKGLSPALVDLVVAEEADVMNERIDVLEKAFKASVKTEVEKRLTSTTPKKNLPMDGAITQEQFRKMPLSQQAQLYKEQPDLYNQLTRR